jgi:hypothetical protein
MRRLKSIAPENHKTKDLGVERFTSHMEEKEIFFQYSNLPPFFQNEQYWVTSLEQSAFSIPI